MSGLDISIAGSDFGLKMIVKMASLAKFDIKRLDFR